MSFFRNTLPIILLIGFVAGSVPLLKNVGTSSKVDEKPDDTEYRLPTTAKPSLYDIKLVPNIGRFTFDGESSIDITVVRNITEITLHAKNLTIDETFTNLIDATTPANKLPAKKHTLDTKTDFLTLQFDLIVAGNYTLNLKYNGILHDDMNGFYRSSYENAQGEKIWLATTQFEPTHARRAFPCFDEPALKAQFKIAINHYKNYSAVSNMPVEETKKDDTNLAKQWTVFETTPVMSTYLVAFVISDFKPLYSDDGKFTIWSKPDAYHKNHYALELGQKSLEELNNWTGTSHYSIVKKMDNFAIPDFRAGARAMENWGIVTYRESALLYEEGVTSTIEKQGIATVISHEFAHQWFGNLVGPDWWSCVWLNEGFANYFQFFITDKLDKTWRLMDQFVTKNLQETAFIADDKDDAHPMNGDNINSPSKISQFFDGITYSKAGSVIRMIANSIGENVFQTRIKKYLDNKKYGAAKSDDLFTELTTGVSSVGLTSVELKKAFDTWANQPGYPVITVIRNYETGEAVISQHRFMTSSTEEKHPENWYIPINYATRGAMDFTDTKPSSWLEPQANINTTISGLKKNEWVIFNKQQTGYYRVNYDGENWMKIITNLRNSSTYEDIHVLNRAQLLDDSFHLAQANELPDHSIFLDVSTYLKEEVDYIPWQAAFRAFGTLDKAMTNTDKHDYLKLYIRKLVKKLEQTVSFNETDEDDHIMKLNRIEALKWACYVGSEDCTSKAHEKLLDHVQGSSKLSPDLRGVLLCAGIRSANATTWNELFSLYEKMKDSSERSSILSALGCSTDSEILNSFLTKSIAEKSVISPDKALQSVLVGSPSGVDITFEFIDKNLEKITEIDNNKTESVTKILTDIGGRMTIQSQVDKLQSFIKAHKELPKDLTDNALSSANKNIEWCKKFEKTIGSFLDDQELVPTAKPNTSNNSSRISQPTILLTLLGLVASLVSRIY